MAKKYRTLDDVTVEYYRGHPEEIESLLQDSFADYFEEGDPVAMLFAIRIAARVKGISTVAGEIGMSRQGLQKALSPNGNPRLNTLQAIMNALGYQLVPQKVAGGILEEPVSKKPLVV